MDIRLLFVLPENCKDEKEASELMQEAYEACRQNVVNVSWIKQSDLETADLSKTDFVIFQEFKGVNFESLKESKCARILGPWCVFVCLIKGIPIPNFTWPIYNVAMYGCVVSCSHIPKAKKSEIKEKVQLMGGCYTDNLISSNTHLVTESVRSEKYLQAAETGIKLFTSLWVDAVWEASQRRNIHCNDQQFSKYKCPIFHNLTISSTGFPNVEMRTQTATTVANNGGIFTPSLALSTTDVLIVHGENGISSKKYKAARANPNIFCVTLDWVYDSIEKGYALPHNLYEIQSKGTSTPTKEDESAPNFSLISAIGDVTSKCPTQIEESILQKKLQPSPLFTSRISPTNKRKCSESDEVDKMIDGLDIKKAKKAGQYLDGCSVYLAGFKPDQRDKLCRILNLSGATRYDDISESLTHIIVGDSSCAEVKIIKSKNYAVSLVSVRWLLDSLEKQQALDEENYLINLHVFSKEQFNSPLGKKGLSLLRTNNTLTPNDVVKTSEKEQASSQAIQIEDELMEQYLRPAKVNDSDTLVQLLKNNSQFASKPNVTDVSKDADSSKQNSEYSNIDNATSQESNIFYSKKFLVTNFSLEDFQNIKEQIESVLGTVMPKNYKGIPDYVVAPAFVTTTIQMSALEMVNNYWIDECIQEYEEIPIQYYHRPIVVTESKPLENCVVTTSGHTGCERMFIKELIEVLGGMSQEQFARYLCVEKNVKASTHLVSLEADGKKYAAALKWGLPVVTVEWLLECAKTGKLVPENKFLMGESKAPTRSNSASEVSDVIRSKSDTPRAAQSTDTRSTPSSTASSRRILTPVCQIQPFNHSKNEKTPVNQRLFEGVPETPCSQVTPINKLMEEVRKTNLLGTPQTPPLTKTWYDVDTPESPFGACIKPHLSPKSKKELMRYINRFPDFVPPPKARKSTPLSEVKRRCWQKLLGTQESPTRFPENKSAASTSQLSLNTSSVHNEEGNDMDVENQDDANQPNETTNEHNAFINTKLQQIEQMVSAISENRRSSRAFHQLTKTEEHSKPVMKDSQPFTVGWDFEDLDTNKPTPRDNPRIFIISGVENEQRQILVKKIESLGGHVSELNTYDPNCTHLICPKPARNEKTLSCMASGKWILHVSYVDKCVTAGKFLPEEEFEFGNPKSKENIKNTFDKENEFKLQSIYWWRQEISKRGYGAFNDMRAIVVAQKRDPIVRVIEAGGGQVVDAKPPFKENVHATHCFLESRSVSDFSVYTPLAQQGILCINTLYISDYLYRTSKDVMDAVVPHFSRFYS